MIKAISVASLLFLFGCSTMETPRIPPAPVDILKDGDSVECMDGVWKGYCGWVRHTPDNIYRNEDVRMVCFHLDPQDHEMMACDFVKWADLKKLNVWHPRLDLK